MTQATDVLYDCNVRLAGNLMHEVPLEKVSLREIKLLRKIHGDDSIVNTRRTPGEHRAMSARDDLMRMARKYGKERVEEVLKVDLSDFDEWLKMQIDEGAVAARNAEAVDVNALLREQEMQDAEAEDMPAPPPPPAKPKISPYGPIPKAKDSAEAAAPVPEPSLE